VSERRYPLTYYITQEDPPVSKADLEARKNPDMGAADAIILCSLAFPPNGGLGVQVSSLDGRTNGDVDGHTVFEAWVMIAKSIANGWPGASDGEREIANRVFELVRTAKVAPRAQGKKPGKA
jgi:hypothetical protein